MTIRIYTPDGTTGPPARALSAMPARAGARMAVLDNGKPGAHRLMAHAAEQLAGRTGLRFVGVHRKGGAATPCETELIDRLAREADLVLTGTAD